MIKRIPPVLIAARGWPKPDQSVHASTEFAKHLSEGVRHRLLAMDQSGIARQVVSVAGTGADLLSAAEDPAFAAEYNDHIAGMVEECPDRFGGFAHLPMSAPGNHT
jgi:uncharacterized protein